MAFDSFPLFVNWELTLACNLNCRHCGSSAGKKRPDELTTDEALAICDQLPALLVQEVDLIGGEPLLRRDWPLIARRLTSSGITTKVVTNGLLLGPAMLQKMKEAGIAGIGISLDGLEKTHDTLRSYPGLFHQIMNGIHLLQEAEIPTRIVTTVNALQCRGTTFTARSAHRTRYQGMAGPAGVEAWPRQGGDRPPALPGRIQPARFVCTGFLLLRRR